MAQTAKPTVYFLHSFELKAPPDGPLTLGRIISDSGDPLSSIASSPPRPIPEHLRSPTVETNGTGDQGIPVKTLDGIGGYHYPEIGQPRSNVFRLVIGEIQTIHFTPDEAYLEQSLQDDQVRAYGESSLFMIVGLKSARKVTAVGSLIEEQEESNATESAIYQSLPDFVFAYGLMRIEFSGLQRKPQIFPLEKEYGGDEWGLDQSSEREEESENENEILSENQITVIEVGAAENGAAKFEIEDQKEEPVEEKRPVAESGMVENDVAGKLLEDEEDFSAPVQGQEIAEPPRIQGSLEAGNICGGSITISETMLNISGGTASAKRISLAAMKRAKRESGVKEISIGSGGSAEGSKLIIDEDVLHRAIIGGNARGGHATGEDITGGQGLGGAARGGHWTGEDIIGGQGIGGAARGGHGAGGDIIVGQGSGGAARGGHGIGGYFILTKKGSKFGSLFNSKTSSLTEATSKLTITTTREVSHVKSIYTPRTSKGYNERANKWVDRTAWAKLDY